MATYTQARGDIVVPGSQPATELLSSVNGAIAGCGEAAAAVIIGIYKGQPPTPDKVTGLIKQAVQNGQTVGRWRASGQSTPANLQWLLAQNGVPMQSLDYSQALNTYAGVRPIELGVSNARAFGGADAHVDGHYVTVVGRTARGDYIVSDPNTPESESGQYVVYSRQQIDEAQPFWAGVPQTTPPSGLSLSSLAPLSSSSSSSSQDTCQHELHVFATPLCLDPTVGFIERSALVLVGVAAVIMAVAIFAHSNDTAGAIASRSFGALRSTGAALGKTRS